MTAHRHRIGNEGVALRDALGAEALRVGAADAVAELSRSGAPTPAIVGAVLDAGGDPHRILEAYTRNLTATTPPPAHRARRFLHTHRRAV